MDGKTLARIGAVVFVAVAITATAIEMNRHEVAPDNVAAQPRPVTERDPLDADLARCSAIGEAGPRDPSCLKAWEQNRRRFLGEDRTPATTSVLVAPTTLFPNAPAPADQPSSGTSDRPQDGGR